MIAPSTVLLIALVVLTGLVLILAASEPAPQRRLAADTRAQVGPFDIMDRALSGIQEQGFQAWVRNAGVGTIVGSVVYAFSDAILSLGEVFMAPFRAIGGGLSAAIEGTFGAAVDVVDAGGQATVESFLSGVAGLLGPAAFPVAVGSVVAAVLVLLWGYQRFSPIDWIRGVTGR